MAAAVPLLIQVGVAAGTYVASSLLAPKPKLKPVDSGRFDDIRFTTAEEGAFIPLCFGRRVRLAGNIIWATPTREYTTRTEGRTGGKGGRSQQATPPTIYYNYKKSFAILVCGTPVKAYRRISENDEVIYNNLGSEVFEDFYEAENHAVVGGAVVVEDGECSGGRAVRLAGSAQYVEIEASALYGGLHTVAIFYKAASPAQVYLSANGIGQTLISLPASGNIPVSVTASVMMRRGANTLKIRGASGTADVDRVYISNTGTPDSPPGPPAPPPDPVPVGGKERVVTRLVNVNASFPADANDPIPHYNVVEGFDANGYFEGHTTAGGQARFELFAGVETQPQSAIIVAVEGDAETPAFRDVSYFAIEDYLLDPGAQRLGNFVFEIEPEIQQLNEILLYLYTLDGKADAADCDFSELSDVTPDGFVLDHRAPLEEWVKSLELWFNFDIVPRGGKIAAVKRGGAVVTRLYERELRAHLYGEQMPKAAVKVTHEDPVDLPGAVDVIYLDPSPSKDFHAGNQPAEKTVGFSFDRQPLTFPIVGDANTAHAVGLRYLDALHLAAKPAELVCGFGRRYLIPTDIVEVELEDGTLYTYRITQKGAAPQSLVRFGVVPERASIYGQGGAGVSGRGGDVILVRPPANTLLVIIDTVPLRQEDLGGLILYAAACPRGEGSWPGYHLNRKDQNDESERVGGFEDAATIGVIEAASQSVAGAGFESTREFIVKLYHGTLESRTEAEVRAERVNLALYGSGARWEVLQFLTVEAQTPAAPFVAQYKVTGVVSGLYGTEWASDTHQNGDYFVLVDGAVKAFPMRAADVTLQQTFVGQTAGQALADAEEVSSYTFTFQGHSRKPLAPARVELEAETGLAPRDSAGSLLVQVWPRSNVEVIGDEYLAEFLSDDRTQVKHSIPFREGQPQPALLISYRAGSTDRYANLSKNALIINSELASVRSVSLQTIQHPDNSVEATLRATGDGGATLGLIPAAADWRTSPGGYQIFVAGGVAPGVYVNLNDGGGNIFVADYFSGDSVRARIRILGTRVLFYAGAVTDSDQPVYESAVGPTYPLRLYLFTNTVSGSGTSEVKDAFMTIDPFASVVFTAEQQQRYYGTLKKPVQVRISQHSGVREVGYGPAWEGAI